jgi:hypothetical protein
MEEELDEYSMSSFGASKISGSIASVIGPLLTIILFYLLSPRPSSGGIYPGQGMLYDLIQSKSCATMAFIICTILLVVGGAFLPNLIRLI